MEIKLKTLLDDECGVGDLVILSVYPRLFGVFGSKFPKLPECPKYCKVSMAFTHARIKLDFHSNILDNQLFCFHPLSPPLRI